MQLKKSRMQDTYTRFKYPLSSRDRRARAYLIYFEGEESNGEHSLCGTQPPRVHQNRMLPSPPRRIKTRLALLQLHNDDHHHSTAHTQYTHSIRAQLASTICL